MRGKLHRDLGQLDRFRIIPAHAGQTEIIKTHLRLLPDHPRACGANFSVAHAWRALPGSSPRMRGKPVFCPVFFTTARIIPAHAGQTSAVRHAPSTTTDHPRACGANGDWETFCRTVTGSSPRMRGKLRLCGGDCRVRRIIPAHAGQTTALPSASRSPSDHPRACGANGPAPRSPTRTTGSSPRMRGKLGLLLLGFGILRIIPAHAGQTTSPPGRSPASPDHPRACGANEQGHLMLRLLHGSSPRMRGKHAGQDYSSASARIIPAHAGQTQRVAPARRMGPDHPRACGANYDLQADPKGNAGSSPRMRGKRGRERHGRWCHRIIPAHAGQTRHHQTCRRPRPDHPRACGANKRSVDLQGSGVGSSPRMRGKHDVSKGARQRRRIIPAHAGQTPSWGCRCLPWSDHPRACGANTLPESWRPPMDGSSPVF